MDNNFNNGNNGFNRDLGNVNPYAIRNGNQQGPQYINPQDPRVAPRQPIPPQPNYYNPQGRYPTPPQQPQQTQVPPIPQQPQYVQPQNQVSNQDFDEQFDFPRNNMPIGMPQMGIPQNPTGMGPMPMGQAPIAPQQPQPKKRGFFSFMSKKPQEPQVQQVYGAQQYVNLQSPQSISDVKQIIDMIKNGDTAFVDFTKVNEQDSQRMLDFLSGAAYGVGGFMQPIGQKRFVITPPGTGIRGQLDKS